MGPETVARAIVTVGDGGKRRIVGAGGMGKTHLLDLLAAGLDAPVTRWSAWIEPDRLPPDDGVVLVDDAHLATGDALRALARRSGAVVAAHRPARREVAELLDSLDGSPVVVGPLGVADLAHMLTGLWRTAPPSTIVNEIHAATGGVPRLVAAVSGHQPIPAVRRTAALDELIRTERERLRPGARGLLDAAAILGALDLSLLAAAGGLSVEDATAAAAHLAAVGLAFDRTGGLAPVVADAVRHLTPASDVTTITERAAAAALAAGGDLTVSAEALQRTGVTGPATSRCLLAAARQSYATAPDRAARWIRAIGPGGTAVADRAALDALVAFRQGRDEDTVVAVDALLRHDGLRQDCELRRAAVEAAAVVFARRGAWVRSAELAAVVGPSGDVATAVAAIARLAVGDADGLRATVRAFDGQAPSGLWHTAAGAVARGLVATLDDEPTAALAELLEAARMYELSVPSIPLPESPHELAALVACHLWEFDVAAQILSDAGPVATQRHTLLRGWAALRLDDLQAAEAAATRARDAGPLERRDDLVACALAAGVARRRRDLDGMERAWAVARTLLLRQVPDLLVSQPVGELLIVGARLGERATVERCLAAMRDLVAGLGDPPLWALSLRWDELHVAMACNDAAAARTAVAAARALPGGAGRADIVAAATCWAQLLDGIVDATRIRMVARDLAGVGLARDAARLAGAAAIRVTDATQMRGLLQLARELHGERTPAAPLATDELTPREHDVARHLLAGLTYREIGRQLYLAPKTIEHHVARIRRKLDAGSRAELLATLQRQLSVAGR